MDPDQIKHSVVSDLGQHYMYILRPVCLNTKCIPGYESCGVFDDNSGNSDFSIKTCIVGTLFIN